LASGRNGAESLRIFPLKTQQNISTMQALYGQEIMAQMIAIEEDARTVGGITTMCNMIKDSFPSLF
jgi:hypothetical protein